ncbi:MAG TPA: DNA mismatch repair protein MutS [Clostridia bacterium]|nr:DNA mismatch repair protein MutS [Clostridia bacterium]
MDSKDRQKNNPVQTDYCSGQFERFEKRYEEYRAKAAEGRKQSARMSNLRLAVFVLGVAMGILLYITSGLLYGVVVLALAMSVFIYLVIRHSRISYELARLDCKVEINRMYMDRMKSGWEGFKDSGLEFMDPLHPYSDDLDIFGPKSLYQWICTAHTCYGRKELKRLLAEPDKGKDNIVTRQEAVRELAARGDFCEELESEGMLSGKTSDDPEKLLAYAEDRTTRFKNPGMVNLFYVLPGAVILSFVLYFLGAPVPILVPLLLIALQFGIFAAGYSKNSKITDMVYGLRKNLGAYSSLLELLDCENFENSYLSELKKQLEGADGSAPAALKKLEGIVNAVDLKASTVFYFILNCLFLWDYHCVFALEDWKSKYGGHIRQWLETVGCFEAVSSLAVIPRMYPEWAFPVLSEGGMRFAAEEMGHPLIRKDVCVRNDFEISSGACIITGSNMSGKTTLLRTVGISLVLAYAGAPVFARRLECPVLDLFTSMRIRDDLNSGISTFYAELLRVKMIIDHSHKEIPMIYLIDEIFMGTNSLDRTTGARSVLKNLSKKWIIGMISTHDFELCELERESRVAVKNYHFTEKYINSEIRFDYRLHPGRSTTTNARYLMKMVGIELEE